MSSEEITEQMFSKKGCCFFWVPSYGKKSTTTTTTSSSSSVSSSYTNWWQRIRSPETPWWKRGLRVLTKVREWSEQVAGPRWKTFIRRFNRNPRGVGGRRKGFQYDPLDYARNFDDGQVDVDDSEYRRFSTRYAALPLSAKSSMDLGGSDAPPLFSTVDN